VPGEQLPTTAAWRHLGLREGFEVLFIDEDNDGRRFSGCTTAIEADEAWIRT